MRNNLRNDQIIDNIYRQWIDQNLQRLAKLYKERFGPPADGRTIYTQKAFHDFCIGEALSVQRLLDPEIFRAILVDYLINIHYKLNGIEVNVDYWNNFFSKRGESK